jgi:hypothetical protein
MTTTAAAPIAIPAIAPEERLLDDDGDEAPEPAELLFPEVPLPELPLPELPLPPELTLLLEPPFPELPLPDCPSKPPPVAVGEAADVDVPPFKLILTQMTLMADKASILLRNRQLGCG